MKKKLEEKKIKCEKFVDFEISFWVCLHFTFPHTFSVHFFPGSLKPVYNDSPLDPRCVDRWSMFKKLKFGLQNGGRYSEVVVSLGLTLLTLIETTNLSCRHLKYHRLFGALRLPICS